MIQSLFYSCFSTLFKDRKTYYNVIEEIIIGAVGIFYIAYIMYYSAYDVYVSDWKINIKCIHLLQSVFNIIILIIYCIKFKLYVYTVLIIM